MTTFAASLVAAAALVWPKGLDNPCLLVEMHGKLLPKLIYDEGRR